MTKSTLDEDHELNRTATMHSASEEKGGPAKDSVEPPEEELDPRAANVSRAVLQADMADSELQIILDAALRAYNQFVLLPTKNTWRKEEGSRRELEREVERTALCEIATSIKTDVSSKIGGCWHVVYGHDFASYVTHRKLSFCHFTVEGTHVMVWRHGR